MAEGTRTDPYMGFSFVVELGGVVVAGFTEVTGLQVEVEIQEYREGGLNEYMHKRVGPTRYPSNLVLKHGITDKREVWMWYQDGRRGVDLPKRKDGSIILLDSKGSEVWRWNFKKAYPVRWNGPDLRANTAEVAVETLELVHQGITLA